MHIVVIGIGGFVGAMWRYPVDDWIIADLVGIVTSNGRSDR